jgi:hypothetical protein
MSTEPQPDAGAGTSIATQHGTAAGSAAGCAEATPDWVIESLSALRNVRSAQSSQRRTRPIDGFKCMRTKDRLKGCRGAPGGVNAPNVHSPHVKVVAVT